MWLKKYPDGGKVEKPKPKFNIKNDPLRPKGLGVQMQDNTRPIPVIDRIKVHKEIQNRVALAKINSQPQLKQAVTKNLYEQKLDLAKKEAYATSQPNAKLVNGQLEEINPGYKMEGQPFGPNEKRFDKGLNHIATGLEVAGYLTGAGELYRGLRGIKTAANAVEDVFWNGKSYQKTPLSNPTIVSQSQGIDALPAGYNANLGNQSPYVAATTDEALMTTQGRVDWNGVNSDNISNWFNTRANKSEIDWAKWNSEIPTNKALMSEYNTIEQTSKAKGTWMKNPDGSAFQGSPEQFIQQNSSNFKQAFPNGFNNVYRGVSNHNNVLITPKHTSVFTGDESLAKTYATNNERVLTYNDPAPYSGVHNLAHPKSSNSVTFDGMDAYWTDLNLTSPAAKEENIRRNIPFLEKQLKEHKEFLSSGTKNSDGSWSFPDTDVRYSDYLYKQGSESMEKTLNTYKDRLKNINNLVDNPQNLEKIRTALGDIASTDDIAKYVEDSNMDFVKIKNIHDGSFGDVSIVNHKPGNYLKSLRGNNGMFDMTNPNIYKALVPAVAGVGVLKQKKNGGTIKNWLNKY